MKVSVQELSPIEKSLSIEVEAATVARELDTAYAQLSRQVKIPGFRPGKIPRRILEQRFKAEVEDDVIRRVVTKSYVDAVKQHKLEVVADPQVTNGKIEPEKPFAFTARVEVKPKVEVKDFRALPLKKVESEITDKTIEDRLEAIRANLTTLEKVEGRDVAQKGDFTIIDYTAKIDGKDFPGSNAKDVTVEVAPGELVDANLPQLEGVKIGDSKEFDYVFPKDYRVEEVQGKTAQFKVTLKELKEKRVPPLDDALAEKSGAGVHTLKELRDRIRRDLGRAEKRKTEGEAREAIITELIKRNSFDVPRAMIERGMEMMLESAYQMMTRTGMDPRTAQIDWNKLREDFRPRAENEVRGQLMFEAIAQAEKIEVNDEDMEKKLEELAEETGNPLSQVRKAYKSAEAKDALKNRIREEKTIAFLKSAATYS
jgi:trigger factor